MKKVIIIIICLFLAKEGFSINELRQALVSAGSKEAALQIYDNYSNSQKASVWTDKLTQVLSLSIWNTAQINLLNDLKGHINEGIFEVGSTSEESFNSWYVSWKASAIENFDIVQLRFIITLVSDFNASYTGGGTATGNNCNCATNDDYCDGIIISTGDSCTSGSCSTKSSGCGRFWMKGCNGTCNGAQPAGSNIIY
jgi:hypothetical protein